MKNFDAVKVATWKVIDATRKVHAKGSLQVDEFNKFMDTIQAINSLPRNVRTFNGYHFDEWNVPAVFKGLVNPNSVTLEQKDDDRDYLVRMDAPTEIMESTDFNLFASKFYGIYKKSGETVTLSSLKTNVTLNSVVGRDVHEDSDGKMYLPNMATPDLPLNLTVKTKQDYVYVNGLENVIERYWLSLFSQL